METQCLEDLFHALSPEKREGLTQVGFLVALKGLETYLQAKSTLKVRCVAFFVAQTARDMFLQLPRTLLAPAFKGKTYINSAKVGFRWVLGSSPAFHVTQDLQRSGVHCPTGRRRR